MSDSDSSPKSTEQTTFGEMALILGAAVAAAIGMALWMRASAPESDGGIDIGKSAPEITAPKWVNGEPSGEPGVKLVHAWFTTCHYCWKRSPEIVALHEKYGDRVQFIGLAPEGPDQRAAVEHFVKENKFTWPNGYAAQAALRNLEVTGFPSRWVIDSKGRIVWNGASREPIERALERALAEG